MAVSLPAIEQRIDGCATEENCLAKPAALQVTGPDPTADCPIRAAEHFCHLAQ